MVQIQQYSGQRIKDGSLITGYAAKGTECGKTFILVPATADSFHIMEVDGETLKAI